MPVTSAMVKELKNRLIQDQRVLEPSFQLGSFKREEEGYENIAAAIHSEEYAKIEYEHIPFYKWVMQCIEIYRQLKESSFDIGLALGEHAWLAPYLPIMSSEEFHYMSLKHLQIYSYIDASEISLQSLTALMIAYHSNPALFTENRMQFEALANDWLEALLTSNNIKHPELMPVLEWWHDDSFCSTRRNFSYLQILAELSYNTAIKTISHIRSIAQLNNLNDHPKTIHELDVWTNHADRYNELNQALVKTRADYQKFKSHAFVDAVRCLQSLSPKTVPSVNIMIAREKEDTNDAGAITPEDQKKDELVPTGATKEHQIASNSISSGQNYLSHSGFLAAPRQNVNTNTSNQPGYCMIQ